MIEKIKITSDGTGANTFVTYKGVKLPIRSLRIDVERGGLVEVSLDTHLVDLDVEAYVSKATIRGIE